MTQFGASLLVVAHGSRDRRFGEAVRAVAARVRTRVDAPDVDVAYLGSTAPSVEDALARAADRYRRTVVVALLLGNAFHARVDLPALVDAARRTHPASRFDVTPVLGTGASLSHALRDGVLATGADSADPAVGVLVPAVGSTVAQANSQTRRAASRVADGTRWTAAPCFATGSDDTPEDAVRSLTDAGVRTVVVAPWFLAPGMLLDRAVTRAALACNTFGLPLTICPPLGTHPAVVDLVADRYASARAHAHYDDTKVA